MSSFWDHGDSGGASWNSTEGPGLQQGDSGYGHDENANPHDGSGANDNACHNCGALDHFARNCPNNGAGSRACYNCGQEGHNKADCPNPGSCKNCGKEGHFKADCPEPLVIKGSCLYCNEEGHHIANCPTKPTPTCKNCKGEGHLAKDCKENRKFDTDNIPDMSAEEAWAEMKKASDEKDLDDFRKAIQIYSKAAPDATFVDIEQKMREEHFNVRLYALEKTPFDVYSLIDLQGRLDRQYVVGFYLSERPARKFLLSRWPANAQENLERLANAGLPYDRGVPKCRNCGELGHIARSCKQEKLEYEVVQIKCNNCGEVGHRVRDCKEKRRNKFGCRNCGSDEHEARDCPEPHSAADVECRSCGQTGHFARDCPQEGGRKRGGRGCHNCGSEEHFARDCDQPRESSGMICRNCDQPGHAARDCPEPKDWSKVEMGHTARRFPQTGGQFDSAEAGHSGLNGTEYGDGHNGNWQPQDSWTGQSEQSYWDDKGADKPLGEQGLSQKLADVGFEADSAAQVPEFGW